MARTRRLTELLAEVSSAATFPDCSAVTIAFSGGADSASLALVAKESIPRVDLLHINHGFAGSPLMQEAAENAAEDLGLPLVTLAVEVEEGPSVEGQARAARYRAFGSRDDDVPILTAHTRDDQAETVVLNIVRGAGLRGMSGIPRFRPPNIHRPFLGVSRSQTREIATIAGLGFRDDPMNLDPTLRRNSVRLQVLPALDRYNVRLTDALVRLAESSSIDQSYLDREAKSIPVLVGTNSGSVPVGELTTRDPAIATRALTELVREVRGAAPTAGELDRIWAVITSQMASTEIEHGLEIRLNGPLLTIKPSGVAEKTAPLALVPGTYAVGRYRLDVTEVHEPCRVAPIGVGSAIFPAGTELVAEENESGHVSVTIAGEVVWEIGLKRHPVAFYDAGSNGYLSVIASEGSNEWTSSL